MLLSPSTKLLSSFPVIHYVLGSPGSPIQSNPASQHTIIHILLFIMIDLQRAGPLERLSLFIRDIAKDVGGFLSGAMICSCVSYCYIISITSVSRKLDHLNEFDLKSVGDSDVLCTLEILSTSACRTSLEYEDASLFSRA